MVVGGNELIVPVRGRGVGPNVPIVASLADQEIADSARRQLLFAGNLFVYPPRPSTTELGAAVCGILEDAFGAEPVLAQQRLSETEFVARYRLALSEIERAGPSLATTVVSDLGCDPSTTFVGPLGLSAATGHGFLAHGLGTPQNPHRDTWYAAATCQINWWVPLFDLDASASLAFYPLYWNTPVRNNSSGFRYEEWFASLRRPSPPSTEERLRQPRPTDPIDVASQVGVCCPAGSLVLSSVAHLSSGVPNESARTHFSLRFQTVSEQDLRAGLGAGNLDADPDGSTLSAFVRCGDLGPIPPELVDRERARRRADVCRASRGDGMRHWGGPAFR
jgi:hypothetical protein